jgi:hypothetical protein
MHKKWIKTGDVSWKSKDKTLYWVKSSDGIYDVWAVKNKDGKVVFHNDFDTKKEALKSAKQYMNR